jgi:serine protease
MRILAIIIILFGALSNNGYSQSRDFREKTLILKVKDDYRDKLTISSIDIPEVIALFDDYGVDHIQQKFPRFKPQEPTRSNQTELVDISLIYEIHYDAQLSPHKLVERFMRTNVFEYVEPAFISHPLYVPSDALLFKQWHLEAINAYEAWDIEQGSDSIIMAIIDTGVDWDHPDLVDAVLKNEFDLVDGIDNDSNGYIDDYLGWNFYEDNNDPNELGWSHGTHVAGLAGASTDNGLYGAGSGFNSKVLAIKAGNQGELTHGYEGIIYAVERGAHVINCSWGSTSYTEFGHDIVKTATQQGRLIICGAGNNNNDYDFYPASFPVAMSVAATDSLTNKAIFSSYNYNVDISAPGQSVWSTKNDDFAADNGTSMSAPIVTGAAALLLKRFPGITPVQIKAQLVETATNIDSVKGNEVYAYRLGSGILNMGAALDSLVKISIGMENHLLTDGQDEVYAVGDEISLGVELVNYFKVTDPITVRLSVSDTIITLLDSVKQFGPLLPNGRINNFSDPFKFEINEQRGYNEEVDLKITIESGSYRRINHVQLTVNPDFVNVTVNEIATTVSSAGHVGFANNQRTHGLGFELETEGNLLYEAGLMIGTNSLGYNKVADRVRSVDHTTDRDFWPIDVIKVADPISNEAFNSIGRFNDTSAISDEIGLEITQRAYAYNDDEHDHYMIIEYTIRNVSEKDLSDVFVGMYADWDILNASENRGQTAYAKRLGYVKSSSDVPYSAGIQQLNADVPFYSYMIDNTSNGSVGVSVNGDAGFSTDEKLLTLQNNEFERGQEGAGTDVSHVVSSGSYSIMHGDSISVAFAFMAAINPDKLLEYADAAYKRYNGYSPGENIFAPLQSINIYPNPSRGKFRLEFDLKVDATLDFELYNSQGKLVKRLDPETFFAGPNIHDIELDEMNSGLYFLSFFGNDISQTLRINYIRP